MSPYTISPRNLSPASDHTYPNTLQLPKNPFIQSFITILSIPFPSHFPVAQLQFFLSKLLEAFLFSPCNSSYTSLSTGFHLRSWHCWTQPQYFTSVWTQALLRIPEQCQFPSFPQQDTAGLNALLLSASTTSFPANWAVLLIIYLYCLVFLYLPFYAKCVHLLSILSANNSGKVVSSTNLKKMHMKPEISYNFTVKYS